MDPVNAPAMAKGASFHGMKPFKMYLVVAMVVPMQELILLVAMD